MRRRVVRGGPGGFVATQRSALRPGHLDLLVRSGKLGHGGHLVLRWMASNVMLEKDAADNWKPPRRRSREKIDGIVGLVVALDWAIVHPTKPKPTIMDWRNERPIEVPY